MEDGESVLYARPRSSRETDERDEEPPMQDEQGLTLTQALQAYTSGAAHANHQEDSGNLRVARRVEGTGRPHHFGDGLVLGADRWKARHQMCFTTSGMS